MNRYFVERSINTVNNFYSGQVIQNFSYETGAKI